MENNETPTKSEIQIASEIPPLSEPFREFYDPNGYFEGDDTALMGWLYERRHGKSVMVDTADGPRELTVREQFAFELCTQTVLDKDNCAEWTGLGLTADELGSIVDVAEYNAQKTAGLVKEAVEILKQNASIADRIRGLEDKGESAWIDVLLAGAVVASLGHEGQRRMSGHEFIMHPVSVTTLVTMAMRRVKGYLKQKNGIFTLRLAQYIGLNHDVDEDGLPDQLDTVGTSFWNVRGFKTYPLLHKRVLEAVGVDAIVAGQTAQQIRALTKHSGHAILVTVAGTNETKLKTRTENSRYIGTVGKWALARLVKLADMYHNSKLDQKERPIADKRALAIWENNQAEYDSNTKILQEVVRNEEDESEILVAKKILKLRSRELIKYRNKKILGLLATELVSDAYKQAQDKLAA